MYRNDVVMTPLRVKQAIDSRFVKPSENELNVLINGTWVEFVKVGDMPDLPEPIDCAELLTMYKGDTTLTETPVINAINCTSLDEVFRGCSNLTTVGYIHCPNATSMFRTFNGCSSLTTIPMLDTSSVTDMKYMFSTCSSLTTIPMLDMSNATETNYMFNKCTALTTIPMLGTSSVTDMTAMFSTCSSLTTIPMLDISNATNMPTVFFVCSSLTSVTFECANVRPYSNYMFYGTPIASGNGYIFVPDNLVEAYRTASGWSTHASVIFGHSDKASMASQVQQMTAMNIQNRPSDEELQLMMQEFEDEEYI